MGLQICLSINNNLLRCDTSADREWSRFINDAIRQQAEEIHGPRESLKENHERGAWSVAKLQALSKLRGSYWSDDFLGAFSYLSNNQLLAWWNPKNLATQIQPNRRSRPQWGNVLTGISNS